MTSLCKRNWIGRAVVALALLSVYGLCAVELQAADKPAGKPVGKSADMSADQSSGKGAAKKSKAKDKAKAVEIIEEPDDTEEFFDLDEELTSLVVPPEALGKVDKASRLRFTQSLRRLLQEGISADGAAAAKRYYESSHQACAADPRAAYAYGLAYLEQKNSKDALDQFRESVKHSRKMFLPGLQAVVWTQIRRAEYAPALSGMVELARQIEESKDPWPNDRDRRNSAEWLGRVMAFLAGSAEAPEIKDNAGEMAASIAGKLTGERKQAFELGRKAIRNRNKELKALAARPVSEVVSEMKAQRQEARSAVEAAEADIKRINDEIRDAKKPFEQQIAEANVEIRANGQKASRAAHEIPEAQARVDDLSIPRQIQNGFRTYGGIPYAPRTRPETNQERKSREAQLATANQQVQQLRTTVENARQSMAEARKQRDKAHSDMRNAIASKQTDLREARRKSQECASRLKDVERAALSPDQIKSRVTSLEAYVPLDPFIERDRLLETLKSPAS
ncbi:MAG: hypothetical protein HY290_04965 [Planctomycetia bacterium]|nr:hypothetical protein [Planctomycetia bacterium]